MPRVVPSSWMPPCNMARLVLHWTAGAPVPSEMDREHYHVLIARTQELIRGDHSIADNVSTRDDDYAAHTRRLNTGSIGVALCGMMKAREMPFDPGPYPLTRAQWNHCLFVCADLCEAYGILPTPLTLLTHAEVEPHLGVVQRGKWDITKLPFDRGIWSSMTPGEELRARVKLLLDR